MWIAKGWRRPLEMTRLAAVGQIAFWALLVYLVFRLGDMALRNQLSGAFDGKLGVAFAVEIFLGGILPLFLLARRSRRQRADVLFFRSSPRDARRDLQPNERGPLRNDLSGQDALAIPGRLCAVDR